MTKPLPAFELANVEAFHVASGDEYWRGYRSGNRLQSDRFALKPGWRTVYGRHVETCLVKVTLANGQTGWGEATEPVCPEVVGILATQLIGPLCAGMTFQTVEEFTTFAYDLNRGRGHLSGYQLLAIAALDIAICDALAQTVGRPLANLFATGAATRLPLYLSGIRRGTLAERQALLADMVDDGLTAAKIFVDGGTDETLAEVDALRAGVPGDWNLMVDALWSYKTLAEASDLGRKLAERDVSWLECPLVPEDVEGHRALRSAQPTSVALGETFFTTYQLEDWLHAGAFDIYQPDIGRTGFAGGLAHARQVHEANLAVTPHMGTGSPIVQAAALHYHAAIRSALPCEYQRDLAGFLPDVFDTHWKVKNNMAIIPERAGLGVDIDENALARHTVARFGVPG